LANTIAAEGWLEKVEGFRQAEEALLVNGQYEEHLPEHRAFLADLIADGENILLAIKRIGMVESPTHVTPDDLQATLNSLHTTFRCEHGPKNSRKTNDLIAKLLDGPKP
jgi:hypothetical protein